MASPVNIEARIFVDRPPEVVFDTVAYPFAGPQWELRAGHRLVTEGGLRVGARAEVTAEDDMTLVEEVIELERPSCSPRAISRARSTSSRAGPSSPARAARG